MPARSLEKAVEEIKSRSNIIDIIGSTVELKRTGSNYKACCPFHSEKTPSFVVSERRQSYHCFGCGEGGDVIKYVQKYYNKSFPEAVEYLAGIYNITIESSDDSSAKERETLLNVNRTAAKFFFSNISQSKNAGYDYIAGRKITADTIKAFGIGFAPDNWDSLKRYMNSQRISDEMLLKLGLCAKSEKSGRVYDKYRNRVIFPIFNVRGKVIGFGGRIIGEGEPKYLNSDESPVFSKRKNLYGLNKSKDAIAEEGYAILVEGYMDVVSLYQSGVCNVVASLGTALTQEQAKLLKRYCNKVVLCYDADKAGINAAIRGIDILREADMEVSVLHVDDGKDPDEYVKKHGKEAFIELIKKSAMPDVDYRIALVNKKYNRSDTQSNIKFLNAVAGILATLKPVEKDVYIREIASKYGISESSLRQQTEMEEKPKEENTQPVQETAQKQIKIQDIQLERLVLRLVMLKSEYFTEFKKYDYAFVTVSAKCIEEALEVSYREGQDFDPEKLKDILNEEDYKYLEEASKMLVGDVNAAYTDCIAKLAKKQNEYEIESIQSLIKILEDDPSDEDNSIKMNELMQKLAALQKKK